MSEVMALKINYELTIDTSRHLEMATSDVCYGFRALRAPKRVPVSLGAKNLIIRSQGSAGGPWNASDTPYMVEPMDMLASRYHEGVCFVGPSRAGKTAALLDAWMTHCAINDPGDMLFIQMSQEKAREFSRTRVDRAFRNSPMLKELMTGSGQDDNTHDKLLKNGMWIRIAWPTVPNVSSSDYRYVAVTDYDRIADDIGGEGSLWGLALKRTQTFLSRGMGVVESSPGRVIKDPNWKPTTKHEAPHVDGILGIYNTSDRRRWYWRCVECHDWFEASPGLSLFGLPEDDILRDLVRTENIESLADKYARIVCPLCGSFIEQKDKMRMNMSGVWVPDGGLVTGDGEIHGEPTKSKVAGYWLGGVAAAFQPWQSIVARYLQGLRNYVLTGSEETLKNTVNTDQGMPYNPRFLIESRKARQKPSEKAEQGMKRYFVPDETRFLTAAVDVQGGQNARFIVQVHAVGVHMEQWLVDRFEIKLSHRPGMGDEFAPIDPASYAEDWQALTDQVVNATYKTNRENVELRMRLVVVDTGGEDGVTQNAYSWYRRLRSTGLDRKVLLVKGEGQQARKAPILRMTMVGSRGTGEKGDIPLALINTDLVKDEVDNGLKRDVPGPNYYHFPDWLNRSFFDELESEVRDENGTWRQIRKRNEALDLCVYVRVGCQFLAVDKIVEWSPEKLPGWLQPLFTNSEIISRELRREMQTATASQPRGSVSPRRVARSSYLS